MRPARQRWPRPLRPASLRGGPNPDRPTRCRSGEERYGETRGEWLWLAPPLSGDVRWPERAAADAIERTRPRRRGADAPGRRGLRGGPRAAPPSLRPADLRPGRFDTRPRRRRRPGAGRPPRRLAQRRTVRSRAGHCAVVGAPDRALPPPERAPPPEP